MLHKNAENNSSVTCFMYGSMTRIVSMVLEKICPYFWMFNYIYY